MEHIALYRQFRPENFDEVVEQKAAVMALRQSVKTGRLGHAYLFCGQRGTGKTSIARIFARAINCENPNDGNPCNSCPTCRGIMDGSLLDVIEIDAASNRSIDNIKKICDEVNYSPTKAKHKVYIIDEVHMITNEAFNALLKTLEEPPAHAVFLFATTEPHSIPPTILSRCQRFDFRRISTDSIIGRLRHICNHENITATDDALKLIASISDGAMRDAISVLDQAASAAGPEGITDESIEAMTGTVNISFLSEVAEILIEGRFDELLTKCRELSDSGRDVIQFSLDLAGYFRNLLIIRVVPDPTTLIPASATALKRMYEVANKTNTNTLVGFVSALSKMISDLKWSPSVRTSFEINLLRLCGRKVKMEEAPLVIPDFVEKQAAAAALISQNAKSQIVAPVVEPTVVTTKEETPAPVIEKEPEAPKETPVESPEPEKTEEPEIPAVPTTPDVSNVPETPEISPEPIASNPVVMPDIPSDSEEEPEEDEDAPMENQMDIFNMASSESNPEPEEEKTVEPVEEVKPAPVVTPTISNSIFSGLSSSFMDDIAISSSVSSEDSEPDANDTHQEDSNLYEPTGRIGETKQTALSATFDIAGLVTAPEKAEPLSVDEIWNEIKSELSSIDLTDTTLIVKDDSANVIFAQDSVMMALKANPENKKLSRSIREKIPGIEHVYMYRKVQAIKKGLISDDSDVSDSSASGADSFMEMAKQLGYNTEIHFGDN